MHNTLDPQQLTVTVDPATLDFDSTIELMESSCTPGWIGQGAAEAAARFGLAVPQPGFHLMVVGQPGSGRSSLMLRLLQEHAAHLPLPCDLLYLHNFNDPGKSLPLRVAAGTGAALRHGLEQFSRAMLRALPDLAGQRADMPAWLDEQLLAVKSNLQASPGEAERFTHYLSAARQEIVDNCALFQQIAAAAPGMRIEAEAVLESFLLQFRANLAIDRRQYGAAPVIYDDDPSFQSLFGTVESGADQAAQLPEFLRLRAGNLLRADGGVLMLHLRDISNDPQNSAQLLEKLHRFLRNGRVQIEEAVSHAGQTGCTRLVSEPLPVQARLVLLATPDEYYELQEEDPEFARFFNVKVNFAEDFQSGSISYHQLAGYVAARCAHFALPHFSAAAVALMLKAMHRRAEARTRVSSRLLELQQLMLAAATVARHRASNVTLIEAQDVQNALQADYQRHSEPEMQLLRSIVDGELMIRVHGRETGQINGLSHIDLGEGGFGSPVRISARCFAGTEGVINIDREIEMTGPNHDKGLLIQQNWISASFARLTPLSLNASLVFEQEYLGVEGDSASCAELYALLSAIAGIPLPQGVAVTGAMNQHGEVMAVGGINDKIEGYFRVCQALGLDGSQGVLIPTRNLGHLVLNDAVVAAVAAGNFHIYSFSHVLEGLECLTGLPAGAPDKTGSYPAGSVMGKVQQALENFRRIYDSNKSDG